MFMDKKTKYDTNPLDADFPRQTREVGGATDKVASEQERDTRALESEAPTRRIDVPYSAPTSYPSVFIPPQHQPPVVQPAPFVPPVTVHPPTSRTIPGVNLPENLVLVAPYIPFFLGVPAALVELYLVPRSEPRVRFHAAQGLALHMFVIAVQFIFGFFGSLTGAGVGRVMFAIAAFIFLVISIIRVSKGKPHHIAPLDEATKWLNEKIEPRK